MTHKKGLLSASMLHLQHKLYLFIYYNLSTHIYTLHCLSFTEQVFNVYLQH